MGSCPAKVVLTFALLAHLPACEKSASERACADLVKRYQTCSRVDLPNAMLANMYQFCTVSMRYDFSLGDHADNLAKLTKDAL